MGAVPEKTVEQYVDEDVQSQTMGVPKEVLDKEKQESEEPKPEAEKAPEKSEVP